MIAPCHLLSAYQFRRWLRMCAPFDSNREAVRQFLEGNWTAALDHTREVLNFVPGCTNSTILLMQVPRLRSPGISISLAANSKPPNRDAATCLSSLLNLTCVLTVMPVCKARSNQQIGRWADVVQITGSLLQSIPGRGSWLRGQHRMMAVSLGSQVSLSL